MFFLLRCAFWIALVLLILPIDTGEDGKDGIGINPVAAFFAAQSTISDLSSFCERNPQTCETGGQAISQIGAKAKVSARMIYEYLDENGELTTGATGTLTAADLEPVWSLGEGAAPAGTGSAAPAAGEPAANQTASQATGQTGNQATGPAAGQIVGQSVGQSVGQLPGNGPVPLPRPKGADRPA
ncbi:DUF5330 domain-containing protein [Stappia sp. P2PMeth1]|uniref:DUF5330 domain-containing protein n=1 Tax=Stappia sp. P2PMeth1 TaxID=2003586 RepID=UPI001645BD5E|nr:DUF5330 domain-containing protein [Stappia sp. P2PMeth1]